MDIRASTRDCDSNINVHNGMVAHVVNAGIRSWSCIHDYVSHVDSEL